MESGGAGGGSSSRVRLVEQAIERLYSSGESSEQRVELNRSLLEFQGTQEAWSVAAELLASSTSVQVLFFAAHTLYTKITLEWSLLAAEQQLSVRSMLCELIRRNLHRGIPLVLSRLCLALAAVVVRSISNSDQQEQQHDSIRDIINIDPSGIAVLEVLEYIPEELSSAVMSEPRREETYHKLGEEGKTVVAYVQALLQATDAPSSTRQKALKCLHCWLKQNMKLSVNLFLGQPICQTIFRLMGTEDLFLNAVDVLYELFSRPLDTNLVRDILRQLLPLQQFYDNALIELNEEVCLGVCRLFAGLGMENVDVLLEEDEVKTEAAQLIDFLLKCSRHPSKAVVIETFEFWEEFGFAISQQQNPSISNHDRHARMQPLFVLLQILVGQQLCLPEPCNATAHDQLDPDISYFRKKSESTLSISFHLLKDHYLAILEDVFNAEARWQLIEASLFALQIAGRAAQRGRSSIANPQNRDSNLELLQRLRRIIARFLVLSRETSAHPLLVQTGLRMLGEYAPWLQHESELMEAAFCSIVNHLSIQDFPSHTYAARALKALCLMGKQQLLDAYPKLIQLWTSQQGMTHLKGPARTHLIEGMTTLALHVPKEQTGEVVFALCAPMILRLKQLVATRTTELSLLSEELQLFSSAMRTFHPYDYADASSNPVMPVLREAWPLLQDLCEAFMSDETVMMHLCSTYVAALMAAKLTGLEELLSPLVATVMKIYSQQHFGCCLEVLSTTFQIFGNTRECHDMFAQLLQAVSQISFSFLNQATDLQGHTEVVSKYFDFLNQALKMVPGTLLPSSTSSSTPSNQLLEAIFKLAVSSLCLPERDTAKAVLGFLSRLAKHQEVPIVRELLLAHGNEITVSLFEAMVKTVNNNLVHYQADLLFILINSVFAQNAAMKEWLSGCILNLNCPFMTSEEKVRTVRLLFGNRENRVFKSIVADLAHILAGEMTGDILLSYELPK
ncbi:hypothetical protein QOT17_010569 [Balamuthia mandrillaris]